MVILLLSMRAADPRTRPIQCWGIVSAPVDNLLAYPSSEDRRDTHIYRSVTLAYRAQELSRGEPNLMKLERFNAVLIVGSRCAVPQGQSWTNLLWHHLNIHAC